MHTRAHRVAIGVAAVCFALFTSSCAAPTSSAVKDVKVHRSFTMSQTANTEPPPPPMESTVRVAKGMTIADAIKSTPGLSTFTETLDQANMLTPLAKNKGPYTVFAPTNRAFTLLSTATAEQIAASGVEELRPFIRYHMLTGVVPESQIHNLHQLMTVQGGKIFVKPTASGYVLNGKIAIRQSNIKTRNGFIHVIDGVLIPPPAKK